MNVQIDTNSAASREETVQQLLMYAVLRADDADEPAPEERDDEYEKASEELWRQCLALERRYVDQMQEEARRKVPLSERCVSVH